MKIWNRNKKRKTDSRKRRNRRALQCQSLEKRELLIFGAGPVAPPVITHDPGEFSGVVRLNVELTGGGVGTGSGVLLADGLHILTAAHVVEDASNVSVTFPGSTEVEFDIDLADVTYSAHGHNATNPYRDGNRNDYAVFPLPSAAPALANRYQFYTDSLVGNDIDIAGYGLAGTVTSSTVLPSGDLRSTQNTIAFVNTDGTEFQVDVDHASYNPPANSPFSGFSEIDPGMRFTLEPSGYRFSDSLPGLGASEGASGAGDSGGPALVNGAIAGIVLGIVPAGNPHPGKVLTFSTGADMRSTAQELMRSSAQQTIVLDMNKQTEGNDNILDEIVIQQSTVFGPDPHGMVILVNGNEAYRSPAFDGDMPKIHIIGSGDAELVRVEHDGPVPVSHGLASSPFEIDWGGGDKHLDRWTNPYNRYDVNANGVVSPNDALATINFLASAIDGSYVPADGETHHSGYNDVNEDNIITPLDALHVINQLARLQNGSGGEGEEAAQSIDLGEVGFLRITNQSIAGQAYYELVAANTGTLTVSSMQDGGGLPPELEIFAGAISIGESTSWISPTVTVDVVAGERYIVVADGSGIADLVFSNQIAQENFALGNVNLGVAVDDFATGTGFIMYSEESTHTRFSNTFVGNSDHLLAVRFEDGRWKYNANAGAWYNFTPESTDRLIAAVDFSGDTIESLAGVSGIFEGIQQGFQSGDLTFNANHWDGSFNDGEFTIGGTSFTADASSVHSIGAINHGIAVVDTLTGTGYVMFSEENLFTRFGASGPYIDNSDHLIGVRYFDDQWHYDNNNSNDGWVPFGTVDSDRLIASLDFGADTITSLQGSTGSVFGIKQGFDSADMRFRADYFNGTTNDGDFTIEGTYFVTGASSSHRDLGSVAQGVAVADGETGTGYFMHSHESVFSRFAASPPHADNSEHVIAVRNENGQWQYNDDSVWNDFDPVPSDRLLASADFLADTIESLQGTSGRIHGIEQGYESGDLEFEANQFGSLGDVGEFKITGTTFTVPTTASKSLGPVNSGVAIDDFATGSAYIMYTATSVHTRFPLTNNHNSDHLVAVRFENGQWKFNANGATWYSFTPLATDRLIAEIDMTADTIESLQGASGTYEGIQQGFRSGDLTFAANQWAGGANNGEFTVSGTHFSV